MANRFFNPNDQFASATAVYAGGFLYFYTTGTTTLTNTYSVTTLGAGNANSNPVELDSAGRPTVEIFLDPATTYKCVLKDVDLNTIWTRDPVVDPAANVTAAFQVYNGNPNGNVAGNRGALGGAGASVVFDFTNNLLYVCTTSGVAAAAVWTQVASVLSGAVSFSSIITPSSLGADQNNYAPTSFSTTSHVRQDSSAAYTITGWAGGGAGRLFTYTNISAYKHTFSDESTSSDAENRFALKANLVVPPDTSVDFWYDSTSLRWRLKGDHLNAPTGDPGGRLTLTTAVPVLVSDVTGATTVYYAPYKHNYARLYNGTSWQVVQFSELSQTLADSTKSPAAAAVSSNYDMFLWNDAGTLRCTRGPAWTNVTTRGTGAGTAELERIDGTWVNAVAITNGPGENLGLYVGTISTNATGANGELAMMFFPAGAAGGSNNRLDVWNTYNRVEVAATCRDSTNSWTYSTDTLQAANANNANRITVVCGLNEDMVDVTSINIVGGSAATFTVRSAIGADSVTVASGLIATAFVSANVISTLAARYAGLAGLGSHYFQRLEAGTAATITWYGDNNAPTLLQSGIMLTWRM